MCMCSYTHVYTCVYIYVHTHAKSTVSIEPKSSLPIRTNMMGVIISAYIEK